MGYEQILVRITGKDRIGLTAAFMEILARYDAQILDRREVPGARKPDASTNPRTATT